MSLKAARDASFRWARDWAARPWSLAIRLGAGFAIATFALLLVAVILPYWALLNNLDREDDEYLADKISTLEARLQAAPLDIAALQADVEKESQRHFYPGVAIRILDAGGNVIAETRGMDKTAPRSNFPAPVLFRAQQWSGVDFKAHKERPVYLVAVRISTPSGAAGQPVVQIALDQAQERSLLAGYRTLLWIVLGAGLVSAAFIGYGIARRGLRPIQQMAAGIRRIGSENLDERVDPGGLPSELSSLASSFNQMLQRLEDSFGRLSRFSADIAHELRTPIHNVRGLVEVAMSAAGGEQEKLLAASLDECQRLSRLIDNLLFLARAENPRTQIDRQTVDIAQELAKMQEFYEAAGGEAGVAIERLGTGPVLVDLDRLLVQRAVGNLIENALAHTPAGGIVRLSAESKGGQVRIAVSDTGPGIPPEHLPHIFERFHRVDASRSKNTGGVGLGLAIVQSIAGLHGGTVEVNSTPGAGACFTLVLPDRAG